MTRTGILLVAALVLVGLLLMVGDRWLGSVVEPRVERELAEIGLTADERSAGGPLPGEVGLYLEELDCQRKLPTPGYASALNGAEIADAQRSGVFPCASFLGAFDGPNTVFAWRSPSEYPGISYINNGEPGALYIVGGEYPTLRDPVPIGPWLAKADATTGREIWRTYVDNLNASGHWIGNANLNLLANGRIVLAWSDQIVLIDREDGRIVRHGRLPAGEAPPGDVNYKHVTVAPDGTLILKDQTRPTGCTLQGTMAIIKCIQEGMKSPNSQLVAVHPDTLEVLDDIPLPEPVASPHIVTRYDGRIAVYFGGTETARRAFWDPETRKLSLDDSWVVSPMQPGQTTMTAPTLLGDWIAFQLNGLGSREKASSVVVIDQRDASRTEVVFPFGQLEPGGWSFAPPKCGGDPENHMLYSADMGMGKVAGIRVEPGSGKTKVEFVVDDVTNTFQPVIGPKDRRVLLLTDIRQRVAAEDPMKAVFTENYSERLTWRDAATGRLLAASDWFEPLTINSLTTPGYGGRVYFPTAVGRSFLVLQVMPGPGVATQ